MQGERKLKIITFMGKSHEFQYIPIMTVGQLKLVIPNLTIKQTPSFQSIIFYFINAYFKLAILQVDNSVPDFDFLYAGRMIRSNDKVLEEFVNEDNMTLYTNSKGVHGGCSKFG